MNRVGIMLSEISFSNMPVLFHASGLDFFILDCEHGGFDYSEVSKLLMTAKLCGVESIVRLPDNGRKDIIKFMDMGADGLLLPMTDTAEDIEKVVRWAKYPPVGKRGISTMRAHTLYSPPEINTYITKANFRSKIFAQIETKSGVKNAEQILNVEGVTGCMITEFDETLWNLTVEKMVVFSRERIVLTFKDGSEIEWHIG